MIWPHVKSLVGATRNKALPIVEMPLATVNAKRLPNAPDWATTVTAHPELRFRGTELAHAVIQADYLNYTNPLMPGIGFVLHSDLIIDWQSHELCLRPGGPDLASDFVETSLAGRVGQGLAILFAKSRGYAFKGHLREMLRAQGATLTNAEGKALPVADFVFEDDHQSRALVEAKASFKTHSNCPKSTKATLKDALVDQVNPWMATVNPPATKAFAVASYLRDHSQPAGDQSVLAFVDPDAPAEAGTVDLPHDYVKRENYAAWLAAMGLTDESRRLRSRSAEGAGEVPFIIFEVAGLELAFPSPWDLPWDWFWDWPFQRPRRLPLVAGIEVRALQAISEDIQGNSALDDLRSLEQGTVVAEGETYDFSVFPDRTFLGIFEPRRPARFEMFTL